MSQTLQDILSNITLYSDDQLYNFVKLPPRAIMAAAGVVAEIGEPFCALIIDKDEVTLMIPADALVDFSKRLPGHQAAETAYRLITFDNELEPSLTGFMAAISAVLADANIPIMPFAAYSRDHIFVPQTYFDQAMAVLEKLKASH